MLEAAGARVLMTRTDRHRGGSLAAGGAGRAGRCRRAGLHPQQRAARRDQSLRQQRHERLLQSAAQRAARPRHPGGRCSAASASATWASAGATWPSSAATWMPSVLTEGLFMMLPDQEAALRLGRGAAAAMPRPSSTGSATFLEDRARDRCDGVGRTRSAASPERILPRRRRPRPGRGGALPDGTHEDPADGFPRSRLAPLAVALIVAVAPLAPAAPRPPTSAPSWSGSGTRWPPPPTPPACSCSRSG